MKKIKKIILGSLILGSTFNSSYALFGGGWSGPLPVYETGEQLIQSKITAKESIAQTMKQIEEYRTQLEQYKTDIQNLKKLPEDVLLNIQGTIVSLEYQMRNLARKKELLGGIDQMILIFQADYKSNPCIVNPASAKCTPEMKKKLNDNTVAYRELERSSNEDILRASEKQLDGMARNAKDIERMERNVVNAEGNMQALEALGQLQSATASELLQIRQLLHHIAQRDALNSLREVDEEARINKAEETLHRTTDFKKFKKKSNQYYKNLDPVRSAK